MNLYEYPLNIYLHTFYNPNFYYKLQWRSQWCARHFNYNRNIKAYRQCKGKHAILPRQLDNQPVFDKCYDDATKPITDYQMSVISIGNWENCPQTNKRHWERQAERNKTIQWQCTIPNMIISKFFTIRVRRHNYRCAKYLWQQAHWVSRTIVPAHQTSCFVGSKRPNRRLKQSWTNPTIDIVTYSYHTIHAQ